MKAKNKQGQERISVIIYFDNNKEAYGEPPNGMNSIATVDVAIWNIYAGDKAGTTWDIVNGKFVQLKNPLEVERKRRIEERSDERGRLLAVADTMLAKATDYISTEYDIMGKYTNIANAIKQYKIDVRSTIHQLDYPFTVVYPSVPAPVPTPDLL